MACVFGFLAFGLNVGTAPKLRIRNPNVSFFSNSNR